MSWQIGDVLDYERVVAKEQRLPKDECRNARREWFLTQTGFPKPGKKRRRILRVWLEWKREDAAAFPRSGKAIYNLLVLALFAGGLLIGASYALGIGLLEYEGEIPINLRVATWSLVWIPLLLTAYSMVCQISKGRLGPGLLLRILGRTIGWGMALGSRIGLCSRASAASLKHVLDYVLERNSEYKALRQNISSLLVQWWGLGINLGIGITLFVCGKIFDLAFGWQTTGSADLERFRFWVDLWAWPWKWAGGGVPGIEQIEGSRVIFNEPDFAGLDHAALQSWWPYLLLLILFYGIIFRLVLLLAAGVSVQWNLLRLRFDDKQSEQVFFDLIDPCVSVTGGEVRAASGSHHAEAETVALIPKHYKGVQEHPVLQGFYKNAGVQEVLSIRMDDEEDRPEIESLSRRLAVSGRVILAIEGFHPFTTETGLYLTFLINSLPESIAFRIVLITDTDGRQAITDAMFEEWCGKVHEAAGCQNIELEKLELGRADD